MPPSLKHRSGWSIDTLSQAEFLALIETARSLKRAARAGAQQPFLLRGKNLAVLCDSEGDTECLAFERAATSLGAHVARIRPSESRLTERAQVHDAARMLGRLYDAIECKGMAPELVEAVARDSGVPVFNGLCERSHPMHALADLMTLCERAGKPLNSLSLCYVGDPAQPRAQALLKAATLAGMDLRVAASSAQIEPGADLVWDDSLARAGDPQRIDNEMFTLQALLIGTMT